MGGHSEQCEGLVFANVVKSKLQGHILLKNGQFCGGFRS